MRSFVVFAIGVFAGSAARHAQAQANVTTFALRYEAPAECPNAEWFRARVQARTNAARFDDGGSSLAVEVTRKNDGRYHARLHAYEGDARSMERTFEDERCEDVVDATAVVVALAADASPKAPDEEETTDEIETASTPLPIATHVDSDVAPVAPTPARAKGGSALSPSVLLAGAAAAGISTQTAIGGEIGVWLASKRRATFSPAVGFALQIVTTAADSVGSSNAVFSRAVARIDGCPLRWVAGAFAFFPCATIEAGALHARGVAVEMPTSVTRPWLALGLSTHLRASFGRTFVETTAGFFAPVLRDTFVFDRPRTVVDRPSPVGAAFALGAGLIFE